MVAIRKLGGIFGLCAMDIQIPNNGGLVCDPPNKLPQICTLVCNPGFYSSGQHRDIACADAMCEGQCKVEKYECKGSEIKYASRPCEYSRYTQCEETHSGLCIETVQESCTYSYYEEVSRPCCNITQVNPPEDCWTSGCTGSCDTPGVFHYYSSGCGDVCPPWRDPETPNFVCSPCKTPLASEYPSNTIVSAHANYIRVECEPGYWGTSLQSYCMTTDGSFYPPVSDIQCFKCSSPPELHGEFFESSILPGIVEFTCRAGYEGSPTKSVCNQETGVWSYVEPPYCEIAASPSVSHSVEFEDATETARATETVTPTYTTTPTPSASKSPRPPKVKGSRAPTLAPKLRPQG